MINRSYLIGMTVLLFTLKGIALDVLDPVFMGMHSLFKNDKCSAQTGESSGQACLAKNNSVSNQNDMKAVSKNVIIKNAVKIKIEEVNCSQQQWKSFANADLPGTRSQALMVTQINSVLPDLQKLKYLIEKLGREFAASNGGPSGAVLRNSRKYKNRTAEDKLATATIEADFKISLEAHEAELQILLGLYQQKLSEIPNADSSIVRSFIEGRLGNAEQLPKLISAKDFQELISKVSAGFDSERTEYQKTKDANNNYQLSLDQKSELFTDPAIISSLLESDPNSANEIKNYQCEVAAQKQIKGIAQDSFTVASFLVSGGAMASAKIARTSYMLRSARGAAWSSKANRALGYGAVVLGGVESMNMAVTACGTDTKVRNKKQCGMTPELIMEEHAFYTCAWDATMAALPGVTATIGALAVRSTRHTGLVRQFVEEMTVAKAARVQNLGLSNQFDLDDRLLAAEGVLFGFEKKLTDQQSKGLIKAHLVSKKKETYDLAELKEKKIILLESGFNEPQADTLLRTGLSGEFNLKAEQEKLLRFLHASPDSPNKFRMLGEDSAKKGDTNGAMVQFKKATEAIQENFKVKYSQRSDLEYGNMSEYASKWGLYANSAKEREDAAKAYMQAFELRVKFNRQSDEEVQVVKQKLKELSENPGKGSSAAASAWQREVIIKHYTGKGWINLDR
ncbi:MAG: hypothetical protein H7061_07530 [Bdellovibrionaceae bacterium]|nr:hypothetical protein [Bdellovibrio sp.]